MTCPKTILLKEHVVTFTTNHAGIGKVIRTRMAMILRFYLQHLFSPDSRVCFVLKPTLLKTLAHGMYHLSIVLVHEVLNKRNR